MQKLHALKAKEFLKYITRARQKLKHITTIINAFGSNKQAANKYLKEY